MLKKLIAAFIAAATIFNAISIVAAETVKYDYAALGDSIAAGYGLDAPERQAYPALFANTNGLTYKNYGVNGKTSEQLLEELKNGDYDLSAAKVITVSIGSNDIMQPMIKTLAAGLGVDPDSAELDKAIVDRINYLKQYESTSALKKRLKNMEASVIDNAEFYAICENTAKNNIPLIAGEIRKQNANAQIIFTNFYNPFKNKSLVVSMGDSSTASYAVGDVVQPYIDRLNNNLAKSDDYKFADVYGAFTTSNYVNVQIDMRKSDVSFDPHPNAKGHRAIYLAVSEVFEPIQNEEFLYGDANGDGQVDASDALDTLQKVLKESYVLGIENKTDNWEKYIDVDGSGNIEASDAADIMQKVLKESFLFAVER